MQTFKLDSNNNLIVNNNIVLIDKNEALLQDINTKLRLIKGEYPFNIDYGVDYFHLIQNNNRDLIKEAVIKELQSDSRISQVIIDKVELKNNTLILSIKIITINGDTLNV